MMFMCFAEIICPETPTTPKSQNSKKRGRYYNSDDPSSAKKVEESPDDSHRSKNQISPTIIKITWSSLKASWSKIEFKTNFF